MPSPPPHAPPTFSNLLTRVNCTCVSRCDASHPLGLSPYKPLQQALSCEAAAKPSFLEQSFILGTGTALRRPTQDSHDGSPLPAFWAPKSDIIALKGLLFSSPMNLFLVLVPIGFVAGKLEWNATAVFCLVRPSAALPSAVR